jgi:hypothetical protein
MDIEAMDRAGYPGIAPGTVLVVDGRVVEIRPSVLINYPYRLVRFEGSSIVFNVTGFNPNTGPVGEWSRISVAHDGETEAAGPESGHRWNYLGKTVPPGGQAFSLAGLALGLSVLAWGIATVRRYESTRDLARSLKERLRADRAALEEDPATREAGSLRVTLDRVGSLLRRGQLEAARSTVEEVEVQLARAQRLGRRIAEGRARGAREAARGFNAALVEAVLDEAEASRRAGDVPAAEQFVEWVEANLREAPRARELLALADASLEANRAAAVEDAEADRAALTARERLEEGLAAPAVASATRAIDLARAISPRAQAASREIAALEEGLRSNPIAQGAREVRECVREAQAAYHLGQFDRARAEARVGLWLVDPASLSHGQFQELVEAALVRQGFKRAAQDARAPGSGFVVEGPRGRTLVVTSSWREFPSERVLLAAKDFIAAGAAQRALVYSSVFANTSTDDRVEVVDARQLVELLRHAAIAEIAAQA